MRTTEGLRTNIDLADRLKRILAARNLTLHQASKLSEELYGRHSRYFVPHNQYHELRSGLFSPSLHQVCTLSRITDYDLLDWLRVFGFSPEKIPQLQVALPSRHTVLLDPSLESLDSWIPWFRDRSGSVHAQDVFPLGRVLESCPPRRRRSFAEAGGKGYLYLKIGTDDALAYPDLLPGSIVRVDPRLPGDLCAAEGSLSDRLFLLRHNRGFWCSRLRFKASNRICLLSNRLPFASIEFRVPEEARILGVVDMEIRRVDRFQEPEVPKQLARQWEPEPISNMITRLSELLRFARSRAGLSFREAASISREIAGLLGNEHYFAASGSLSDYEAQNDPPRHIHKIITLCALYGVHLHDFLNAAGIDAKNLGKEPIPPELVSESGGSGIDIAVSPAEDTTSPKRNWLVAQFGELPFFLRGSLEAMSGIRKPSLHDFFWIGEQKDAFHPSLRNALLVIVNRHKKKPVRIRSIPLCQQPLYMLMTRDGRYLCASCSIENSRLVIHPLENSSQSPGQFRISQDAEMVGQIVTIVRKLA